MREPRLRLSAIGWLGKYFIIFLLSGVLGMSKVRNKTQGSQIGRCLFSIFSSDCLKAGEKNLLQLKSTEISSGIMTIFGGTTSTGVMKLYSMYAYLHKLLRWSCVLSPNSDGVCVK